MHHEKNTFPLVSIIAKHRHNQNIQRKTKNVSKSKKGKHSNKKQKTN